MLTADADFGALLALGSLASPSVLLLRSADHLRPSQQAELIVLNLPPITNDLRKGAIASLTRDRLRVRELPISTSDGSSRVWVEASEPFEGMQLGFRSQASRGRRCG